MQIQTVVPAPFVAMEDDFEREFADELSMIQDEGDLNIHSQYQEKLPVDYSIRLTQFNVLV